MVDPVFGYVAQCVLVVLMALGAVSRLRAWGEFEMAVAGYRLLPMAATRAFAVMFVGAECASVVLLLTPTLRLAGALCAAAVIGVATLGVLINLIRGRTDIDCGCGGLSGTRAAAGRGGLSWWLVLRNGALLALVVFAAVQVVDGAARQLSWVDGVTFCGASLAALGLYAAATQLVASHVQIRRNEA